MTDTPPAREGESAWVTLRRRKVVQWGVAYVAGAWALLQGLAFFADVFGWPYQSKRIASLLLVVGLPIALVLAWYHGDRGEQRISRPELAWLVLLGVMSGGVLWFYGQRGTPTPAASTTVTAAMPVTVAAADERPSIAVLPFENRSREADDAFFVDGIHDDILAQLSKVSALRVISRTSVEQFRDTKLPIKTIADQLGVTKILEGGVQRGGDRIRINVQLIDASTDAHLWAESYDRELTTANIFAIQSELAAAIAGALQAALTPAEQQRAQTVPTQNLKAWEAYQLGKQRFAKRNTAALAEAEAFFRKAVVLDPKFALAWVGLADTLSSQVYYGSRPRDPGLRDAEKAAAQALELDPNLAEAWASHGNIARSGLDLGRSERMLRRSIALNPNYAPAHHWLSMTLTELGHRADALSMAERAVALDPLSAIINNIVGYARVNVGRFDDALVAFRQATEIDPMLALPYGNIGALFEYGFGRVDKSVPWYEKAVNLDPGNPENLATLVQAHSELGDDTAAERWLAKTLALGEETAYSSFVAALRYLQRRDAEPARRHAQIAAELDPNYLFLVRDDDIRRREYAAARARYAKSYPQLLAKELPTFNERDASAAIDLALVLQHTGESERANALLERSEAYLQTIPRMGAGGYGIADVAIHTLRGDSAAALVLLREAEQAGWRTIWRYYRDFDPNLASIRNEPEFKAVFADIERDMAQQRARLAARPKDAPLELSDTIH